MKQNIKAFAAKVCDYSVSTNNRKLTGYIETAPQKYKWFKLTGVLAKKVYAEILRIENIGFENIPWSDK